MPQLREFGPSNEGARAVLVDDSVDFLTTGSEERAPKLRRSDRRGRYSQPNALVKFNCLFSAREMLPCLPWGINAFQIDPVNKDERRRLQFIAK